MAGYYRERFVCFAIVGAGGRPIAERNTLEEAIGVARRFVFKYRPAQRSAYVVREFGPGFHDYEVVYNLWTTIPRPAAAT